MYHELVRQWAGKPIRLQFAVITKTKQPDVELHPEVRRRKGVRNRFCVINA